MTVKTVLSTTAVLAAAMAFAVPASAKIATGATVADMQVTDSNGALHNLSDYAGKTVVLE